MIVYDRANDRVRRIVQRTKLCRCESSASVVLRCQGCLLTAAPPGQVRSRSRDGAGHRRRRPTAVGRTGTGRGTNCALEVLRCVETCSSSFPDVVADAAATFVTMGQYPVVSASRWSSVRGHSDEPSTRNDLISEGHTSIAK
ncbi:hypothetical protein EVAR_59638_1 [Eumeta japonica]|uniref:Uncharacterized protein n=1 Tax=Eumeta variegata TaxID=151549 RepID=A0A4C1YHH5_EUMVA|nr:hypothetical protein EVAR_59638_1 [Eumeta japonica]